MAFTLIAHGKNVSADGGNTAIVGAIDTSTADLLVVVCRTSVTGTLADSKSNTWTSLTFGTACRMFYCVPPGAKVGTGHTFTITDAGSFPSICACAFQGVNTASALDGTDVTALIAGATAQPGSITPAGGSGLFVTGTGLTSAASCTHSIDSGFTISDQNDFTGGASFGSAMAYKIKSDAVAENPTWTFAPAATGGLVMAAFLLGAASTPGIDQSCFSAFANIGGR